MARELRFGICTDQNLPWPTLVERWQYFERLGFDSVWDCDHYIQPSHPDGPYFEGWTLLAGLAAVTQRIRIGVLVSSNTFRHPALLAKEAVTVDHISNGRLELGIGAGWYVPEHEKFGLDFPRPGELVGRFREAVEIVDRLMRNDVSSYEGRYYRIDDAPFRPGPVQQPRPPLTLGAKQPRMLEIVARYGDAWNSTGTPEELGERNRILDEACARVGRDPEEIVRSVYGWAAVMPFDPWESVGAFEEVVGRYREAGINEFIIDQPPDPQMPVLERVATDVIPRLRQSV
ncbi:MAG TPA: LLM class flavin-dependent oxidoreductase [Thermomicrobiaceae bacterium]|nr:LLM class flavin-dependent oxidoreductase [Thermomicrobiaceae bacterium]